MQLNLFDIQNQNLDQSNKTEFEYKASTKETSKFFQISSTFGLSTESSHLPYINSSLITSTQASPQDIFGIKTMTNEFVTIHLPGIVVSILIITLNIVICRKLLNLLRHNIIPGVFKGCVMDFVSAGEATIVSWELITIFHEYGLPLWTLCAFICMNIKTYFYQVDCVSCPYTHIQSYLRKFISSKEMALRILSQFFGGSVFFHWQSYIWDLGLTDIHVGRAYWMSYGRCTSWLSVPTWMGFLFEFFGSLLCNIASLLIFDFELVPIIGVHPRIIISSTVTVSLVLVSFYHTGGFFQPLLAFARTYGCVGALRQVTVWDHIVVYWLGATIGSICAMYLAPYIKQLLVNCNMKRYSVLKVKIERIEDEENIIFDSMHES